MVAAVPWGSAGAAAAAPASRAATVCCRRPVRVSHVLAIDWPARSACSTRRWPGQEPARLGCLPRRGRRERERLIFHRAVIASAVASITPEIESPAADDDESGRCCSLFTLSFSLSRTDLLIKRPRQKYISADDIPLCARSPPQRHLLCVRESKKSYFRACQYIGLGRE
jgi:hypothetical protein